MVTAARRLFTPEEYLLIERNADYRSQYYRGEIYAMAGASLRHVTIVTNLILTIGGQLRGKACGVYGTDLRVLARTSSLITYPDVVVACPPLEMLDTHRDTLLNPRVIIEVLSESTESFDRDEKWIAYRAIPSLTDYLLVSQPETRVEHHSLEQDGSWRLETFERLESLVTVASIECTLALSEVYDRVDFAVDPHEDSADGDQTYGKP